MRKRLVSGIVVALVVVIVALYRDNLYSGMAFLRLMILLSAIATAIAAFGMPAWAVLLTAGFLFLLNLPAISVYNDYGYDASGALALPLGMLLIVDVLAVALAQSWAKAARVADEREGLTRIGQALAEGRTLAEFADVIAGSGQQVMGPGTLRLWALDRQRDELRCVRLGDHPAFEDAPDAKLFGTDLDRVSLDAPSPLVQAVSLAEAVEATSTSGWAVETDRPEVGRWASLGFVSMMAMGTILKARFLVGLVERRRQGGLMLAEPVLWRGQVVGVLSYEPVGGPARRFASANRSRLASIAALCAVAIGTARPVGLAAA